MTAFIGAIDQGTSSTRFIVFDREGRILSSAQIAHRQHYPQAGWVEHDAVEILRNTLETAARALDRVRLTAADLAAVGIANQRETTVLWDRRTGEPLHRAIVWQDTRTRDIVAGLASEGGADRLRAKTGLPLATYFSAPKLAWLLDEVRGARALAESGDALFGTLDCWLLWNLTGGPRGGAHVTDVTNASRTQLMSLSTLDWDAELLETFGIPRAMLPRIVPSSGLALEASVPPLAGARLGAVLGDQQAALVGEACFEPGQAKNTYGTGCFVLMNTGERIVASRAGLITTVAYRMGSERARYALEGSIAVTGALVQWLRDNLGLIGSSAGIEALAREVPDNGGVYFVPAFSGLYAPHWNSGARGIIAGLTQYSTRAHVARAALESAAYQTREILEAMERDADLARSELRVDGGMAVNELLMQFQADILDAPVVRPRVTETTALGAAYAAGLAAGCWSGEEALAAQWSMDKRFTPALAAERREQLLRSWRKAVARSLDWLE